MSVVVNSVGTDTAGTDTAGADGDMEDKQDTAARSDRRHLEGLAHLNTAVAHQNTAVAHLNTAVAHLNTAVAHPTTAAVAVVAAGVDQQLEPLTASYENRGDWNIEMFAACVIV
jgi:uncharacterized coiled-coil protein SlyX